MANIIKTSIPQLFSMDSQEESPIVYTFDKSASGVQKAVYNTDRQIWTMPTNNFSLLSQPAMYKPASGAIVALDKSNTGSSYRQKLKEYNRKQHKRDAEERRAAERLNNPEAALPINSSLKTYRSRS